MQCKSNHDSNRWPCFITAFALLLSLIFNSGQQSVSAQERLSQPAPRTALNGAIHYQRAILFLTAVDPTKRKILQKPIWEIVTPATTEAEIAELNELLIESRHAIRAAVVGSNQSVADFGLDIRQYMVSALLPHTQSMIDLSRLIALVGVHRESEGRWKDAADVYFATLRMGRHMTHQATLAEAIAGVEILETAYFSLGRWAAHCPDVQLVEDAFDLLSASTFGMVQPARTMQSEASILRMRMEALSEAYPDGPWAEMVLETLGADFPAAGPEGLRKAAQAAAFECGVPHTAFDSKATFLGYLNKISTVYLNMANETAHCLSCSAPDAIRSGEKIAKKYQQRLVKTKNTSTWEPAKLASLFAVHEAELTVLRVSLAISAAKTTSGFPADLSVVADKFGGKLPTSPYDGSSLVYEVLDNGKGYSLSVSAAKVGEVELPAIQFSPW